jgi:hypothetical protein
LLWGYSQQMDVSRGVFVKRHGLKQNVVASGVLGNLLMQIDNLVDLLLDLKRVGVHLFADFALEALPVVRTHIHVCGTWSLELLLGEDPVLKALKVDYSNRSFAFAS